MKHALGKSLLGNGLVRSLTLSAMRCGRLLGRLASYMRARALFGASDVIIHWTTEVKYPQNVTLGKRVMIGPNCTIGAAAPIFLGDDVLLSKGVFVDTGLADISTPVPYVRTWKPIRIEDGVWLGAGAMVLAGVTIGRNSVITAGTIVRKSVPPESFVTTAPNGVQSFVSPKPVRERITPDAA